MGAPTNNTCLHTVVSSRRTLGGPPAVVHHRWRGSVSSSLGYPESKASPPCLTRGLRAHGAPQCKRRPLQYPPNAFKKSPPKRDSTMIKPHKWGSESSSNTKVMLGKHSTECEKRVYLQMKKEKKRKRKSEGKGMLNFPRRTRGRGGAYPHPSDER